MNCPNCGESTRDGALYCGNCGARLDSMAGVTADPAPLLVPPPPPPGVPKEIEIVPFGADEDQPLVDRSPSTIIISPPPPGIGAPPPTVTEPAAPPLVEVPATAESLDETRISVRRGAGNRWRLVLPDGRQVEVAGALLVGREPSAHAQWPGAAFLTISDGGHSISKTHAVFETDAKGLSVTDLDSTNGVVIIQPDDVELDLAPNVPTSVQPGSDIELGDFVIQVERG